jgi:hypothetical protein
MTLRACRLRIGAAVMVGATVALGAAVAQAAETASQTFATPGEHAFVVPAGVTSVQVTLVGGAGGAGSGGAPGGSPATATATLTVSPGETLYGEVAGNGQAVLGSENAGGYNGGGSGGEHSFGGAGGGGGGGASDLRMCPASALPSACQGLMSLASRLIVAAGGGGGGGSGLPSSTAGGNGGPSDQPGSPGHGDGHGDVGGSGGQRAILSAGGEPGSPSAECNPKTGERCPTGGQLGAGGPGGGGAWAGGGGGGGGGVYGGGGAGGGATNGTETVNGGGGGGGGGSSGIPAGAPGVSGFSLLPTAPAAQPAIAIVWIMPPPAVQTGAPSAVTTTTATVEGTVNPDGSQVTDCRFVISPAPPAGASIPCPQQIGAGSTPVAVSAALTGLSPASPYTVTLVATSAQGSTSGSPVTLLTSTPGTSAASPLTLTNLRLSLTRFRRGRHAATIAKTARIPTATVISFALSRAATLALSFEQARPGVLVGHRCTAGPRLHRNNRRCTRYVAISHGVTGSGHASINRISFDGVLDGGPRLSPGAYRLSLTASDAAARTTATQHPTFTLLG